VTLLTDEFTKSMLTHHANHSKETQQFARACKLAQSGSDKSALELIDKFNKNFKKVFFLFFVLEDESEDEGEHNSQQAFKKRKKERKKKNWVIIDEI
jgi:hypothetical protein